MKQLSIHRYFGRIAFRVTLALSIAILCYLGVNLYLQLLEKKSQLNLQASYVANALRNEFINGNQIYLYEQCRSLAAQENIRNIVIRKSNYILCSESDDSSKALMISVTVPIKFQPELSDSESAADNIAGTVTLGVDGKEMVYYAFASLIGLLLFSGGSFIYIKRSYLEMQRDIVNPIKNLTDAMKSGSGDFSQFSSEHVRIDELQTMLISYKEFLETTRVAEKLKIEKTKSDAVISLANQVAHDIRSPLSVLNLLVPTFKSPENSEKCELLILATERIDKIAEDLLSKGRLESGSTKITSSDLESIVLEKQMLLASQSRNIRIDLQIPNSKIFSSRISKIDFGRIASNLLNNALEAFSRDQTGIVELGLSEKDNSTVLVIKDNGKGIPENVLSQLGNKGFTHGKINGNGLGVHHAKSTIEQAGGKFDIQSKLGMGTIITITI